MAETEAPPQTGEQEGTQQESYSAYVTIDDTSPPPSVKGSGIEPGDNFVGPGKLDTPQTPVDVDELCKLLIDASTGLPTTAKTGSRSPSPHSQSGSATGSVIIREQPSTNTSCISTPENRSCASSVSSSYLLPQASYQEEILHPISQSEWMGRFEPQAGHHSRSLSNPESLHGQFEGPDFNPAYVDYVNGDGYQNYSSGGFAHGDAYSGGYQQEPYYGAYGMHGGYSATMSAHPYAYDTCGYGYPAYGLPKSYNSGPQMHTTPGHRRSISEPLPPQTGGGYSQRCYNCDSFGHLSRECPLSCNFCRVPGHWSGNCPYSAQQGPHMGMMMQMMGGMMPNMMPNMMPGFVPMGMGMPGPGAIIPPGPDLTNGGGGGGSGMRALQCYNCGQTGHRSVHCKETCQYCGLAGHWSGLCPSRPQDGRSRRRTGRRRGGAEAGGDVASATRAAESVEGAAGGGVANNDGSSVGAAKADARGDRGSSDTSAAVAPETVSELSKI